MYINRDGAFRNSHSINGRIIYYENVNMRREVIQKFKRVRGESGVRHKIKMCRLDGIQNNSKIPYQNVGQLTKRSRLNIAWCNRVKGHPMVSKVQ